MKETELLQTTDAKVWAEEFVRLHGGDEGLMLAWFANAMMCADDHAGCRNERHLDELQHAIFRLPKPPSEMGDGPDERVGHILDLVERMGELLELLQTWLDNQSDGRGQIESKIVKEARALLEELKL